MRQMSHRGGGQKNQEEKPDLCVMHTTSKEEVEVWAGSGQGVCKLPPSSDSGKAPHTHPCPLQLVGWDINTTSER